MRKALAITGSTLRGAKIIFDTGAKVGLYSLLAASANPTSPVYASEPTPEMATALAENIRLNCMQKIVVERMAAASSEHTGFLDACRRSDGANEGMNYVTSTRSDDSDLPVAVSSLDDYCRWHAIEWIDLMKVAIEGGEYDVLVGARRFLHQQAIGCLVVKMIEWAANRSRHSIEVLQLDAGYRLYRMHARELVPIAAGAVLDCENVVAFPREQDQVSGQQAS